MAGAASFLSKRPKSRCARIPSTRPLGLQVRRVSFRAWAASSVRAPPPYVSEASAMNLRSSIRGRAPSFWVSEATRSSPTELVSKASPRGETGIVCATLAPGYAATFALRSGHAAESMSENAPRVCSLLHRSSWLTAHLPTARTLCTHAPSEVTFRQARDPFRSSSATRGRSCPLPRHGVAGKHAG